MEEVYVTAHDGAFEDIAAERAAQKKRWGDSAHTFPFWLLIFGKQTGHLTNEVLEYENWQYSTLNDYGPTTQGQQEESRRLGLIRLEAIQAAAVLVAMIEQIDEELYPEPEHEEGSEPEYPDGMFMTEAIH
jgi:hypothetical protein